MIMNQVARIVVEYSSFLNFGNDEELDLDRAMKELEWLSYQLEHSNKEFLSQLLAALAEIVPEYEGEQQQMVRDMANDLDWAEAAAADDPVRLAEIEKLREEEDP